MATVTPPRDTRNLEQDHSRIKSPLSRLRKYIHSYVSLEGAALVGLFLALWFWIGMILDYGVFKLLLLDWVQELHIGVRVGVLVALVLAILAIVAFTVLTRLFVDFTDAAVALVLERRFPKLLGDRLITSVELSDPDAAAALGYSGDMVRETIHEAAERVNQLPVKEVFDWKRLIMRAVFFGVLTLVLYGVVGTGFAAVRAIRGEAPALGGYSDFNEVSTIWVERNILLRNTIWPRRAYLEIVDFPDNLRIPRESAPPALRVRAWKYVIADPESTEGWRLLTWADLQDRADLAGDAPALPADWKGRDEAITVDEVEIKLDAFPIRTSLPGDELPAKWCIASDQEDSGWRPLMWKDLTKEKLGGLVVPGLPGAWDVKALPALIASGAGLIRGGGAMAAASRILVGPKYISLTVDDVQKQLENADTKTPGLPAIRAVFDRLEALASIRDAVDRVDAKAAERSMARTMRKLIIPANVTLVYKSNKATNTNSMTRVADNEFTGSFGELKDSVSFTVRGEDYVTKRRQITVVDRPRLEKLDSEEERPAYLYYRPAKDGGSPLDIRGQRQPFSARPLSVSGDVTTIDVPIGTSMTLTATGTKRLTKVALHVEKKDAKTFTGGEPVALEDGRSFRMRLPDIRREQKFTFRFTDEDEVTAERKIVITPREDTSPRVREFNPDEVIRRGKEGYLVAVGCRIPFKSKVRDDNGLARVRYGCRIIPGDFLSEQKLRALEGIGALPLLAPGSGTRLMGLAYLAAVTREMSKAVNSEASAEQYIELPGFAQALEANRPGDGRREFLEKGTILSLLAEKQQQQAFRKLLSDFTITPDRWTDHDEDATTPNRWVRAQDQRAPLICDLPLWLLTHNDKPLKDADPTKPQKRYLVEIRLVAEDTYLDGDLDKETKLPIPHVSASGETFTFVIVPENELLSKIAEEEEIRYREMQKAYKPLPDNRNHIRDTHFALSAGGLQAAELNAFIARCDSLSETVKTSQQDTKAVYQAYERILRELRTNQLRSDVVNKVYREIVAPLQKVTDVNFGNTYEAVINLRKALDSAESIASRVEAARPKAAIARDELNKLVAQMEKIMGAMEGLAKINELIEALRRIEKQEEDFARLAASLHRKAIEDALKDDPKPKKEK